MQEILLPVKFLADMKHTFELYNMTADYQSFINTFSGDYVRGIRMNSLKVRSTDVFVTYFAKMNKDLNGCKDELKAEEKLENKIVYKPEKLIDRTVKKVLDCKSENGQDRETEGMVSESLVRVPWSTDGFYISNDIFPGRHPFYKAGVFYLQEPSAMVVAYVLDAKPGDMVLDLCAAPGGKSVKIAADMQGKGVLFSNDINEERVKALLKNIELAGCPNCIVLNEKPENIADKLEGFFDKILVDAPCSGEGMFRKDTNAPKSWEKFGPDSCVVMQRDILSNVDKMLRAGGVLVYSTCTFNTFENEKMIEWFLENNNGYEVEPIEQFEYLKQNAGVHGAFSDNKKLYGAIRILPHKAKGEGHFCIKLRKKANLTTENLTTDNPSLVIEKKTKQKGLKKGRNDKSKTAPADDFTKEQFLAAFLNFADELLANSYLARLNINFAEYLKIYNGHVYTLPQQIPSLDGLKVPKKGLYLGKLKRLRDACVFEPSHSFALSLKYTDFKRILSFSSDDTIITKYLKCETISFDNVFIDKNSELLNDEGYIAVAVDGFVLGWGKIMKGGMMKNLYPSGWVN